MNLPNKITVFRVILIPFFLFFLIVKNFYFVSLAIFIVASITDSIDGYIARRDNLITNFGKLMDPLADKLLVNAAFIGFIQLGLVGSVPVFLIIAREFLVTSIRMLALEHDGSVIPANFWGKLKTTIQMVSICVILIMCGINSGYVNIVSTVLIWLTVAITLISGFTYVKASKDLLKQ